MENDDLIQHLLEIKKTILLSGEGGIIDTVWMSGSTSETLVDRLNYMLAELGVSLEHLQEHEVQCNHLVSIDRH